MDTSPLVPSAFLPRPHLLERLQQALARCLTLVSAPAGYGKTTLLSLWARHLQESGAAPALAWAELGRDDRDLSPFLATLGQAVSPYLPGPAARVRELLADQAEKEAAALLANSLKESLLPVLLILDDVHLLDGSPALEWLDRLLRNPSPRLHVTLSSRHTPELPAVTRLRAAGQVAEITQDDLRFSAAEVVRLFDEVFHLPLKLELGDYLARHTEGWAVALQLAYQASARQPPDQADRFLHEFGGTARPLYDYLAGVVLQELPESLQSFLLQTSLLEQLEPALCDALLDRDDSAALLAQLERTGLFTTPQDSARSTYRYHALFREFLQRRLLETRGRTLVEQLHRRAAAWFLDHGLDERAVDHLLAVEDFSPATELIYAMRERLFDSSRYHLLQCWLDAFPPAIADQHPWLLLLRARLSALQGDYVKATQLYRCAEPILLEQQDSDGLYRLYYGLSGIQRSHLGDHASAVDLALRAIEHAPAPEDRAGLLAWIAQCYYQTQGAVPEVFEYLASATELAQQSRRPFVRAQVFELRGKIRASMGHLVEALEDFHLALETCGSRTEKLLDCLSNGAYLHCLLGELEQARPMVQRTLELAHAFGRKSRYAYALNLRGLLQQLEGNWEAARQDHTQALGIQHQIGANYSIPVTINWLGLSCRGEGRLDEALRWGEEGLRLREQMGNEYETGLSLIDVGATYLALGRLDEADALWERALDIFTTRHPARYEQAQLHFYLAVLAQQQENEPALIAHLEQSLALAHMYEHGTPPRCLHFFITESAWSAPLLAHAVRQGRAVGCVDCLLPRLGQPALQALLPLLKDARPSVRARAARLLGDLGHVDTLKPLAALGGDADLAVREAVDEAVAAILAVPPPPLRVQGLGRWHVWRGDVEISRWERSAGRTILQYLLAHRTQPVPVDVLVEGFWPDNEPEKARKNVHQAITSLRRTLEPELAPGMPSRYLRAEDGSYSVELPPGSWIDYEEFEARLRPLVQGEAVPTAQAVDEILALYRGDYLADAPYEEWTILPRERMRTLYQSGLRLLARAHLQQAQPAPAVDAANRALELDAWDEEAALLLMQAHVAQGSLTAALRVYEALRDRLQADLDIAPRRDLNALYDRLRQR